IIQLSSYCCVCFFCLLFVVNLRISISSPLLSILYTLISLFLFFAYLRRSSSNFTLHTHTTRTSITAVDRRLSRFPYNNPSPSS
ncbi:hypothetical protein BDF22DRAFT_732112, partial [Syncephalis plumigaleata]